MAHVITDECAMCGACLEICPTDAISEGDEKYIIDADKCEDCAVCVEECPTECIEQA